MEISLTVTGLALPAFLAGPVEARSDPAPLAASPAPRRFHPVVVGVVLALVALVALAAYLGLRRTEETLTVAGFEWERQMSSSADRLVRASVC